MQGERGDDLGIGGRIFPVDQPFRDHGTVIVFQRLSRQSYIRAHAISEHGLKPGVHGKLHLLVIRTVHIGLHHTVFKSAHAHPSVSPLHPDHSTKPEQQEYSPPLSGILSDQVCHKTDGTCLLCRVRNLPDAR